VIWWLLGAVLAIGLMWALTPALTAPKARRGATVVRGRDDGFVYWPPCPRCGNIAVSCVARIPENAVPAEKYRLACDHGLTERSTKFCNLVFEQTHAEIMAAQPKLRRERR